MAIPEWLKEHRELQALRAASSATPRPRRRKKRRTNVPKSYVEERYDKLEEIKNDHK
jgi:hypothetical protein